MLGSLLLTILTALVCVAVSLFVALRLFYKKKFNYWKERNVKEVKPVFPWGNMDNNNFTRSFADSVVAMYNEGKNERYVGMWMFYRPVLIINDPDIIKDIAVKDFMSFHDRTGAISEENDPLSANLLFLKGTRWRNLRVKLTPVFTTGKIKLMFPLIVETTNEFVKYIRSCAERGEVVEVKDAAARYLTDVISNCAFGLKANSIQDPESLFRKMGKRAVEPGPIELLKQLASLMVPAVAERFKLAFTPKDVEKYFIKIVTEAVEYRRNNNVKRNDFLQMLMKLQDDGFIDEVDQTGLEQDKIPDVSKLTLNQVAAQAFLFFVGGFDTSSNTMQFTLYELALNQEIQAKCRQEVDEKLKKYNGEYNYDAIQEMEYLDRVVSETLRKYPPISFMVRECNKNYQIPGSDLVVEEGTMVHFPAIGIQNDAQYYPEPHKFDPDRFLPEVKATRHQYTYLPFGHGPRNCIGNRFALIQTKIGLAGLLSNFQFDISSKTPIPMKFSTSSFNTTAEGGMPLKITVRK